MPAQNPSTTFTTMMGDQKLTWWIPNVSGAVDTPPNDPPPPPTDPPPTDDSVRFQHTYMCEQENTARPSGGYSLAEATRQAQAFDVISCQTRGTNTPMYSKATLDAMRLANPRLKMYVYSNGGATNDSGLTEAAYGHSSLTTTSATRCKNPTWGTLAGEPSHAAWQDYIAETALQRFMLNPDYDGVFLDVMGDYPLSLGIVNPDTGQRYTSSEFYALTAHNAKLVQDVLPPGKKVIANGLSTGVKWPTSKKLVTEPNGVRMAMPESFTRLSGDPTTTYQTPDRWLKEITMLKDAVTLGVGIYSATKVWKGTDVNEERLKFGFGSMMLVDNGTFALFCSLGQSTTANGYAWQQTNYGVPLAAYFAAATDVYRREFSRSTLVVNVSSTDYTASINGSTVTCPAHCSRWFAKSA